MVPLAMLAKSKSQYCSMHYSHAQIPTYPDRPLRSSRAPAGQFVHLTAGYIHSNAFYSSARLASIVSSQQAAPLIIETKRVDAGEEDERGFLISISYST